MGLRSALRFLVAVLVPLALGCPGTAPCRTSRDCADGEMCVDMACVPRVVQPDAHVPTDAFVEPPDAFDPPDAHVVPDAFVEPDAYVEPPDAFDPPDGGTDAFMIDPCTDGVTSGDESDVDCGGASCPACAEGRVCRVPTDCALGMCSLGVCGPPPPSCTNGMRDGEETHTDCGGTLCAPCADGLGCALGRDCRSRVCDGTTCSAPTCTDMAQNGAETDVDCGGAGCPACPNGRVCAVPGDCASGICTAMRCVAPSCTDGMRNGTETDVDCGGGGCPGCAPGGMCGGAADCASMECSAGRCLSCVVTTPRWTGPFTCTDPFCTSSVGTLRPSTSRRLEVTWVSTVPGCSSCDDTFTLTDAVMTVGPTCSLCPNATVDQVRVIDPVTLEMTIRAPGCDPCTETLAFIGTTVSSSGCTVASCGPQAIRQVRASGGRLELDWGDCGCTQTLTFTGSRTCS